MKINRFGINLDEGIPLNKESLEKFYVSCFDERISEIINWLNDDTIENPLLFGGQIGAGKSTLITKIFSGKNIKPDITLKFDREGLNLDEGDFLSIILAGFIKKSIEQKIDLSFSKLPLEIFKLKENDWQGVINMLYPETFSMTTFEKKILARKSITKHSKYIIETLYIIGDMLKNISNSRLIIFASGIDKFDIKSASFFSLKSSIILLSNFKTLFEVNAVHLFIPDSTSPFSKECKKEFIPTISDTNIQKILVKRMGVYAEPIETELRLITKWSGGNPRQAIRLLAHYQAARKNKTFDKTGRLANAIKRTTEDLFAFANKPSPELIKVIQKDKKIQTSLLNLPGDKEKAQDSLYSNWIFITKNSNNGAWPAIINPLIKPFFQDEITITTDPEQKILSQYAETNGMSAAGLGFYMLDTDNEPKSAETIFQEFFATGIDEPVPLKLTEILDIISAALLSKDRKDRVIIGFKDKNILNAARAYLFAKANSYEFQQVEHIELWGGENKEPFKFLEQILDRNTNITSLEFLGNWTEKQLDILDKYRDRLIGHQMLWWIPLDDLKNYLPNWVQLRELFEVFILEDELLGSLSVEDVEADLAFFEDLVETEQSAEASMVNNLNTVLEYLKQCRGGKNG